MTAGVTIEQQKNLALLPTAGQPCPMVINAPVRFGVLQRAAQKN